MRLVRRAAALAALLSVVVPAAAAACPRASLTDVEDEVMCPVCGTALNVAQAPQADRQRALIQRLVDRCRTKSQIKAALVEEYGEDVLALPDDDGFGAAAYAVPIGLGALAVAGLALTLPRWRRRRAAGATARAAPSGAEARRLEDDIARYDL